MLKQGGFASILKSKKEDLEEDLDMQETIINAARKFLEKSKNKSIRIISHHDTDGITSAAIMTIALKKLDLSFSVKIVKQLEKEFIQNLPENEILVFLDLGSSNLNEISKLKTDIFVIDHHEISTLIPENIELINPHNSQEENISASGLTYLFVKSLNQDNKDLANLAVIGMVGDMLDRELSKPNNNILNEADLIIKKGLLIYPSTRPINKALEYSSILIPGVTGNSRGAINLLKESGIEKENGSYKSLLELSKEETSKLITNILIKRSKQDNSEIIGNIYLIKFFNKLEDARELSARINACARLNHPDVALLLCLGDKQALTKSEKIYADYKQHIISALNYVTVAEKIEGKSYLIINAKNEIKDTIIGTIASILSSSPEYEPGSVIVTMAYSEDKIKVSARICGRQGRNLRELIQTSLGKIEAECGGHAQAAGCLLPKENEKEFIASLKKQLEVELVKI